MKDQSIFSQVIILLIFITSSHDNVWISLGENCCQSLLGLKGLTFLFSYYSFNRIYLVSFILYSVLFILVSFGLGFAYNFQNKCEIKKVDDRAPTLVYWKRSHNYFVLACSFRMCLINMHSKKTRYKMFERYQKYKFEYDWHRSGRDWLLERSLQRKQQSTSYYLSNWLSQC